MVWPPGGKENRTMCSPTSANMAGVTERFGPRYGAILWDASADLDTAIRFVKSFDNPQDAIGLMAHDCKDGERWAVVDLAIMRVVARGASHSGRRLPDCQWLFGGDVNTLR